MLRLDSFITPIQDFWPFKMIIGPLYQQIKNTGKCHQKLSTGNLAVFGGRVIFTLQLFLQKKNKDENIQINLIKA